MLCFDSTMNAERFAAEKSAIFLILPEEDQTKNFMAGLMIQTLAREVFAVFSDISFRFITDRFWEAAGCKSRCKPLPSPAEH